MGKRTLITGGTGFVGTHLVKEMCKEGRSVRILARETSDLSCFEGLPIEVVYGDILDSNLVAGTCKGIDCVVHLAAQVELPGRNREQYEGVNVRGTMNMVNEAIAQDVKRFIFLSSIAAMGTGDVGKVSEMDSCHPVSEYGKSKLKVERALLAKHRETGFPVIIIRPPTVFGEGDRFNFLKLTRQIKYGPYFIIGRGSNKIDFCYVENLVSAILGAIDWGIPGQVYLVTDGRPYTIQEVSDLVANLVGAKTAPLHIPVSIAYLAACMIAFLGRVFSFDPPISPSRVTTLSSSFYFDISKALKELHYRPIGDFAQNVRQTITWYDKNGLL